MRNVQHAQVRRHRGKANMNLCVHESMCNNSGIRTTYYVNVIRLYYYSESRINVVELATSLTYFQ